MKFVALLVLLSSCAVTTEQMNTYEKTVFGAVTPHEERTIDRRTRIADAIYAARARAKKAHKQNEQWCSDRGDGVKVCRVPSWEDFAVRQGLEPPKAASERECEVRNGVLICRDQERY